MGRPCTILREVAINNGMASAREALEGYSRIIYKIMSTGTQVSPDMLQRNAWRTRESTSSGMGERAGLP